MELNPLRKMTNFGPQSMLLHKLWAIQILKNYRKVENYDFLHQSLDSTSPVPNQNEPHKVDDNSNKRQPWFYKRKQRSNNRQKEDTTKDIAHYHPNLKHQFLSVGSYLLVYLGNKPKQVVGLEFIEREKFAIFEVILTQFEVTCAISKSYCL